MGSRSSRWSTPLGEDHVLNENGIRRLFESQLPGIVTSDGAIFGGRIHLFSSLGSTNTKARELSAEGVPEGTVVLSQAQTSGRGRQGRVWISEPGKNLLLSVILRPRLAPELLGIISLFASVSIAACLEKACGKTVGCKWPNDVIISGRKICGILSETVLTPAGVDAVILGIGLNVNQEIFPDEPGLNPTSMRLETGGEHDLAGVLCSLLGELEERYNSISGGNSGRIIDEWTRRSVILGSKVNVECGDSTFSGIALGVGPNGALLVNTAEGIVDVVAGEVHLL